MKVIRMKKLFGAVAPASDGKPSIAESISTLCSPNQLRAIRHLSAMLKIDEYEVSRELFRCRYEELSKSGAADVIRELENRRLEAMREAA